MLRRTILAVLFFILASSVAFANGLILEGISTRSVGRGGTNLGWADNGGVIHDNAGGLINMRNRSFLEVSAELLFSDVDYRDPGGVSDYRQDVVPLGNFAVGKKVNEDVAVGLGVFTSGGFAGRSVIPGPVPFTGDRTYKSFGALIRVLPAVSLRLTDRWSVGATTGVAASHIEFEGPNTIQTGFLAGTPVLLDVQGTGAAFTWSIGSQYKVSSKTTLGVSYQSENRFDLDGKTTTIIPGIGESVFDSTMSLVWPESVGLGVRHAINQRQVASLDLIYYNWQRSFDALGLEMRNASNPIVATFGTINDTLPLKWRDSLSVRTGFEQTLANQDKLRFGYVYHRNPIPASTQTVYVATPLEHTFSVGYGTRFRGWNLDLAYVYTTGDTVDIGTSEIIGGDFNDGFLKTDAHFLYLSFGRGT